MIRTAENSKLPENYRYKMVEVDPGTGHGDERYALSLQKFERRSIRIGIWPFRRTVEETGWWTLEVFGDSYPTLFEYRQAKHSAWTRFHNETKE